MDATSDNQTESTCADLATAIQTHPPSPKLALPSDDQPSPTQRTWPTSAQCVAACLFVGVLGVLAMDRWISRGNMRPAKPAASKRIDVNLATRTQLLQLPGIGPGLADKIIDHRKQFGPFNSSRELTKIHGVGSKMAKRLTKWLCVGGETSPPTLETSSEKAASSIININTATESQLRTLPRIGPTLSKRIVAEREVQPFSSIEDLRRVYGIGNKTVERLRPLVTVK